MDITRAQQIAFDDTLVAPANRLKIGKSNLRLSSDLNSKEATLQVVYDVLKLTPFYKAFQITVDVLEIYMQEFWATATVRHHSIHFKMNNKKHIVNLEYFREMLQICPKFPDQQFEEQPFKEKFSRFSEILRSFAAVINKCLSGKSTRYDSLRLSQAQILWCMYHNKNVDYAYLMWEDFVYQLENKNVKRSNEMYYPRFTKVIVNFFMTKDSSIPRRNKVNWHFARDDPMFTTIKVVSRHEDTQLYGAILPDELTNEAIKDSESYKEYYVIASGAEPPKTKASVKKKQAGSDKTKTPPTAKGKRLKTSAKAAKPAKQKQPAKTFKAKGLTVLSEVALTIAEQIKLATKRSLIQTHSSHASGSGTDEGTGGKPGVPDVPTYESDDEQISWKSSDKEDDDEVVMSDDADDNDDQNDNDTDNKDDDDQNDDNADNEKRQDDEDKEEEWSDDEGYDDENQGTNVEGKELDEEETNEEDELTSLEDVSVTTIAETPLLSATTLPPPPIPLIPHPQQTPIPTPTTVPTVSSIPSIVDAYLANKMHESVKIVVQLQSDRLRDEAQAKNADFINKFDDNIKKIIKDQFKAQVSKILPKIKKTVNEQLEAEVLTRSSNESKTSHAIAANLSELELKKILIDKMESNKSIYRSDEQKNLYKALVDAYKSDKLILDTYGDYGSKRRRDAKELESTSAPKEKTSKTTGKSTEGSKSHHKSAGESAQAEEPMHIAKDLEEPALQVFETRVTEDQPNEETSQLSDWFQKLAKPPTPDRDWNKTLPDAHGPV
ncbi:hypothetical protein Tco_0466009 [Tanacetum coccineum]